MVRDWVDGFDIWNCQRLLGRGHLLDRSKDWLNTRTLDNGKDILRADLGTRVGPMASFLAYISPRKGYTNTREWVDPDTRAGNL